MNNNDMQKDNFIKMIKEMNKEGRVKFYEAMLNDDNVSKSCIAKKYGYLFIQRIEDRMSDDVAEGISTALLKNGLGVFNKLNSILHDSTRDFWSKKERFSDVSLNDSDSVLKEARRLESAFYSNKHMEEFLSALYGEGVNVIWKAAFIADAIGCLELRNDLLSFFMKTLNDSHNSKAIKLYNKKKTISEDRSKAGKGNTSPYKDIALRIASDTWSEYPNASQAGMIDELFAYFRKDRNDNPSTGAIRDWLSQSGLKPSGKDKNRKFKLVINE